ncbi:hypothetical protein R1sor_021763 [Riccia sorocarpa]|uniref:Lon N-terminal domain-containing protein n=1 Tax=Riccia sorocarpa TaxID=122646 RepID=A0ABD3GJW6_9MARC
MEKLSGPLLPAGSVSIPSVGCDVFVGVMPIRLPPPLASALSRTGALHFYTVVRESSPTPSQFYFDFLPESPEDPLVAVGVLLGRKVPGIVQERKLRRLPTKSCWWICKTEGDKGLESVREFNSCWDNQLMLFRHDCRHYTEALVGHLTGRTGVIEQVLKERKQDKDPVDRFINY